MIGIQLTIDALSLLKSNVTKINCNGSDKVVTQYLTNLNYATFEPDFFTLDGNYNVPGSEILCIISNELSKSDGTYNNNPKIIITFNDIKNLKSGVNIINDGIQNVTIRYYNTSNTLIDTVTITGNTEKLINVYNVVNNVKKIEIEVTKAQIANRHSKIYNINVGGTINFDDKDIINADMIEECDLFAAEIPNGELNFDIISTSDKFNFANPNSVYDMLQEGLSIKLYKDNQLRGTYYLSEWGEAGYQQYNFRCVDLLGDVKNKVYYGSETNWPAGTEDMTANVNEVLTEILQDITTFFYSADYPYDSYIGFLGKSSIGTALTNVCQLTGTFLCKDKNEFFNIKYPFVPSDETIKMIKYEDMLDGEDVSLKKIIKAYDISYYYFNYEEDNKIFSKSVELTDNNPNLVPVYFELPNSSDEIT